MKKECFKCHKKKDINQFYVHKQMSDGYLGKCKSCTKKDVKNRYRDPVVNKRIREYERKRFQNPERKKKILEYKRKARKDNNKDYVRGKLERAVKNGKVIKKPCEICGNPKSEGHHEDYRSHLKVRWLCFKHHREAHNQKPV